MNTKDLTSSLRIAISALHKQLRKKLYLTESYSLTEMETIGHLSKNEALLPSELAALTRVKTQSMSQILNKLEQQGIAKRKPSKEDKRKVYVSLTASGKKLLDKTLYDRDEWLREHIENTLSDKETEILAKAIPVLNKLNETK